MTSPPQPEPETLVRLQKVLASAGLGSRRACEQLIEEGRVSVDGNPVSQQGMRVDPGNAVIRVDGDRVNVRGDVVYLAVNKPRGVLSAMSDDRGRRTVADLVPPTAGRLFHVGRLDSDTEGLLLLTNDGELAHHLTHPSFGIEKTYLAEVPGPVPRDLGRRLRAGVSVEGEDGDRPVVVDRFRVLDAAGDRALVELVLHEGRKHVVRRVLAAVGHPVQRLVRTAVGPVHLGDLRPGRTRPLDRRELAALFRLTDPPSSM